MMKAQTVSLELIDRDPPRVVDAVVVEMGRGHKDVVLGVLTNGKVVELITFYGDELSFQADEFIGLTQPQCWSVFTKKDIAFLQSDLH